MSTLTIQPDSSTGIDTFVFETSATSNFGNDTNIQIGRDPAPSKSHGLIKFSLSALPVDAIVSSAVLTLTTLGTVRNTPTINVYRLLSGNSSFTETGATWNTKDGAVAWAGSSGASTSGTDFSSTLMAQTLISSTTTAYDFTLNLTEFGLLRANNYGFFLKGNDEGSNNDALFASCENATSSARPKLTITYTVPSSGAGFLLNMI